MTPLQTILPVEQSRGPTPDDPNALVMNLKMPRRCSGSCAQMEEDASMKTLPVVMLTFSRQEADLVDSYQLGVNTSAVEPVGFRRFVNALRGPVMFWTAFDEPPPTVACN